MAVVDKNVDRHGNRQLAEAYLKYLYSPVGQDVIGRNFYRPRDPAALAKYGSQFAKVKLTTIAQFGGWAKAQPQFFGDGGIFDQAYNQG